MVDNLKEEQIVLMIVGNEINQLIKINENLSINNIKAIIKYKIDTG